MLNMKTSPATGVQKAQRNGGAALLLAVLFLALTAVLLATYLQMSRHEYTLVSRSQTWNTSMVLAEAGVEDALALINRNANSSGSLGNWPAYAAADGWGLITSNSSFEVFYLTNRTPDKSLGYYSVYITNNFTSVTNGPDILSIGTAYWDGNNATLVAPNTVRKVLVQTGGYTPGSEGLIAFSTMNFNGNNVTADSFDSSNPNNSIWQTNMTYRGMPYGLYSDTLSYNTNTPPSRTANVVVATDGNVINVGNANIYGYLDTAPGGTSSTGSQGSVGDLGWVFNNTKGIETGHSRDDMNTTYSSKSLPKPVTPGVQTNWLSIPVPPGGSTNINTGGTIVSYSLYITNNPARFGTNLAYYAAGSLGGANICINASNVVLYLTNGFSLSGNDTLTVNTNGDVQIYTTGNCSTKGNAVIDNVGSYAKAFSLYDVAGYSLTMSFGGNGIGTGYMYVPSSSVSFNGGGSSSYGYVGCLFCYSVTMTGHYTFHFDEALENSTPAQYLATTWQEVQ